MLRYFQLQDCISYFCFSNLCWCGRMHYQYSYPFIFHFSCTCGLIQTNVKIDFKENTPGVMSASYCGMRTFCLDCVETS